MNRLASGARRRRLDQWLRDELPLRFEGRVLGIDAHVADAWGRQTAAAESAGRPMNVLDAFIAATARVHELALVTRNESHFSGAVEKIVNPWRGS